MDIKNLRSNRSEVESLQERIMRLRSAMELGAQRLRLTPGGHDIRDRLADDMAKLDELERELIERTIQLEQDIRITELYITALPEQQRRVIRLRYVEGLSWREVAKVAHYSVDHCFAIHRQAIKQIQR